MLLPSLGNRHCYTFVTNYLTYCKLESDHSNCLGNAFRAKTALEEQDCMTLITGIGSWLGVIKDSVDTHCCTAVDQ